MDYFFFISVVNIDYRKGMLRQNLKINFRANQQFFMPQTRQSTQQKTRLTRPVEKKKKISKPAKPRQKTEDELKRIFKSTSQIISVIQVRRIQQEKKWIFLLRGENYPKIYKTVLSKRLSCVCLDFRYRGKPCKHHYFLVTKILKNYDLVECFGSNYNLSDEAYEVLDSLLLNELANIKMKNIVDTENINLKDDNECLFCFSEMKKQTETLEKCQKCEKYFHSECLNEWKVQNPSCPLCRQSLIGDNPYSMIKSIEL